MDKNQNTSISNWKPIGTGTDLVAEDLNTFFHAIDTTAAHAMEIISGFYNQHTPEVLTLSSAHRIVHQTNKVMASLERFRRDMQDLKQYLTYMA